jgi:hypothetical protein
MHFYSSYSFALKPDWSQAYALQPEILAYCPRFAFRMSRDGTMLSRTSDTSRNQKLPIFNAVQRNNTLDEGL